MTTSPNPWETSTPWIVKETKQRRCDKHGDYTSNLIASSAVGPQSSWLNDWWSRCPSCDDELHKQNLESHRRITEDVDDRDRVWLYRMKQAGIDDRYTEADPFDLKRVYPQMKEVNAAIQRYCTQMDLVLRHGQCLTLMGPPGTGKTHALSAVCNYAVKKGCSALYRTADGLLQDAKSSFAEGDEQKVLDKFVDVDVLAIDEIGRHQDTDYARKTLFHILDKRYQKCRPTLVATNLGKAQWDELMGSALLERLKDGGGLTLTMMWPSLRGKLGDNE